MLQFLGNTFSLHSMRVTHNKTKKSRINFTLCGYRNVALKVRFDMRLHSSPSIINVIKAGMEEVLLYPQKEGLTE